jgi:aminoglycoside 3-N-acetyltransferase I
MQKMKPDRRSPKLVAPFSIARLAPGDFTSMKGLLAMFGTAFKEPETYGGAIPRNAYFERLLGKESVIALAAISEGTVVGGLVAYELDKFEQERREIYIYDLAVAQAHRRNGIATALIEELRQIGRSRGAYVIYVQADLQDDAAIALYSKLGVREDVLHFDIAVSTEVSERIRGQ